MAGKRWLLTHPWFVESSQMGETEVNSARPRQLELSLLIGSVIEAETINKPARRSLQDTAQLPPERYNKVDSCRYCYSDSTFTSNSSFSKASLG